MEGSVQLEYLMDRIDVADFMRLKKRVEKRSKEISKQMNK